MLSMALSAQCKDIKKSKHQPLLPAEICQAQKEDKNIGPVIECRQLNERPDNKQLKSFSAQSKRLIREWEKLTLDDDGILYQKNSHTNTACSARKVQGNCFEGIT